MNKKKILYIDMDNVLVDFQSGIDQLDEETKKKYDGNLDEVPGIFSLMFILLPIFRQLISNIRLFSFSGQLAGKGKLCNSGIDPFRFIIS